MLFVNMRYLTIIINSLTVIIKVRGTLANNQFEVSAKLFLLGLKSYIWKIAHSLKNEIKQQSCQKGKKNYHFLKYK